MTMTIDLPRTVDLIERCRARIPVLKAQREQILVEVLPQEATTSQKRQATAQVDDQILSIVRDLEAAAGRIGTELARGGDGAALLADEEAVLVENRQAAFALATAAAGLINYHVRL
jgi:hypothetical protein